MLSWIDRVLRAVLIVVIAVFTVVILVSIFFRYVLNNSLVWSEQVCRYLYVWMVMLAMPVVYRAKANVAFALIYNKCSPRTRRLLELMTDAVIGFFAGFLALQGWKFTVQKGATIITGVNIPQGWLYVSQPIGGVITILFVLEHAVSLLKSGDGLVQSR